MSSTLGHSPARIVAALLISAGQGSDPTLAPLQDWPCYATNEPSDVDDILVVRDTVGRHDGRLMIDGSQQEHHGFQLAVRASDHDIGWVKANAVKIFMTEAAYQAEVIIGTHNYLIWCFSNVQLIDVTGRQTPKTKRTLITINGTVP